ncbi:MAG TPA: tetratricopeptide repeat protein [Gammaproteobacteria bacterium]|nr:tetratricopeptide repeat protein [Gammaproteobacteria bacterium]
MSLPAIEQLLRTRMGLHSQTVGGDVVGQAVAERMRSCGIDSLDEYQRVVSASETELEALIDSVVIPETWFFRDRNPFTAFCEWLRREWLPRPGTRPLRILSLPCSTGEEAYSLAMCLADCGVARDQAHIDAVDISHGNIRQAREACYGQNSFRGGYTGFRERHFDTVGNRFRVGEGIRERVTFQRGNVLDAAFTEGRQPYQVIFCRNLLIYFDRATQHRVIDQLERILADDGLLFLGHAETGLLLERRFTPLESPRCFGFRRGERDARQAATGRPCRSRRHAPMRPAAVRRETGARPSLQPATAGPRQTDRSGHTRESAELLRQAFDLADRGRFESASELCERLLRQQETCPDLYYLLGLIAEAGDDSEAAERQFRKAVYLQPRHYEALTHLSILCRQRGDLENARRFSERAARSQRRQPSREALT